MMARTSLVHVVFSLVVATSLVAGCAGGSAGGGSIPSGASAAKPAINVGHARPADTVSCPQNYTCGYLPLATLAFDGNVFTEVKSLWSCFPDLWDIPVFTATASGPLVLPSAVVSLAPTCSSSSYGWHADRGYARPHTVFGLTPTPSPTPCQGGDDYVRMTTSTPSPCPTPSAGNGRLYIVAFQVGWDDATRIRKGHNLRPSDDNTCGPVAIAGPVNLTDNPWNFAVIPNALTLTTGQHYIFFVAERFQIPTHQGWW